MSAWNRRSGATRVYYNSYYGGTSELIAGNSSANLTVTSLNNVSHKVC
jgi:hypothetical protein